MNKKPTDIYDKFGRYSFWLAIIGIFCYMFYFPQGMYYCFFCGVMAVALAVTARRHSPDARYVGGIVIGIVDVGLAGLAFYGLYILYTAFRNPDTVSEITELLNGMLSQYGLSLETFSELLH